jgi:hypothetical protein
MVCQQEEVGEQIEVARSYVRSQMDSLTDGHGSMVESAAGEVVDFVRGDRERRVSLEEVPG